MSGAYRTFRQSDTAMLGRSPKPPPTVIEPRPLHNGDGSIRALARQMLTDLDRRALTTAVPTATLRMLLERLCAALTDPAPLATQVATGALTEPMRDNPNLAYWQKAAEEDEDRAAVAEAGEP